MRWKLFLIAFIGLTSPAVAENIRIGGVGAATNLLPLLFAGHDSGKIKHEVIPSLGSNGGLRALSERALDMAVAGRNLNSDEIKLGLRVAATIQTPFVLVTSHPSPNGLSKDDVAAVYKRPDPTWADASPVRVILRPKSDSDTAIWIASFPGMAEALEVARARHDVPVAATDQDNADLAERLQGSLSASTLTQVLTEGRRLRLVSLDGVAPSLDALENGTYPFHKTLHFVLRAEASPSADKFIAFIKSPEGRALLRKTGNILIAVPGAG
jgi:phosphate transport system substrate-binding protein